MFAELHHYPEEPDHQLHKANRLAHEVARRYLEVERSSERHARHKLGSPAYQGSLQQLSHARRAFNDALRKYEKAMEGIDG